VISLRRRLQLAPGLCLALATQQLEKSLTVSEVITSVLQQAAKNFAVSLDEFYPSYGSNGLNERNLTYQMSKAFAARSNAHAFMEVPFLNPVTERYEFRIDCMLFDPTTVAFVECKRLYSPEKAEQLRLDFHRMSAITRAETSERSVYRVMLAETWQ
jgi:hypothetical protein